MLDIDIDGYRGCDVHLESRGFLNSKEAGDCSATRASSTSPREYTIYVDDNFHNFISG